MASIAWACWDGGGNLPPSLEIVHELTERGHDVRFIGRPEMIGRAADAGVKATEFRNARTDLDRYSFHPMATVFGYASSPAVGAELGEIVTAERPDLVVIDALMAGALNVAPQFGRPAVAMVHSFLYRLLGQWRAAYAMMSQSREKAGFQPIPSLDELWGRCDLVHVNTLLALDGEPVVDWPNVVHGAPVLKNRRPIPTTLPWPDHDPAPVVLLSFSTGFEQRDLAKLQRALDALAPLPVHVVATTAGIVDPAELSPPANAWVTGFADHDQLLARTAVVVGHGGHGTTMRALRHGVPIVGVPGQAIDQIPNTRLVQEWGAGVALPPDADETGIRDAVAAVLADDRYTASARALSGNFGPDDGASQAADSIENLLGPDRRPATFAS